MHFLVAFLKIWVTEEDRDFWKFLWIKGIDQKNFELVVKRFKLVIFGFTCSPLLLSMTVRHHVMKYFDLNEDLVVKFLNDLYKNNSIRSSDSSEKCFEFYLRMRTILKEGNFNLWTWISNCAETKEKKIIPSKSKSCTSW